MQDRWRSQNLVAFPLFVSLTRADPFATCQFSIAGDMRLLFGRTMHEKEPGIKSSRRKRRRHPTADKSEVIRVQMQTVMRKQLGPRHSSRLKIVEQGSALPDGQRVCTPRQQHPRLFKHLARSATDHRCALAIAR